jgi:hypothetical protein
MDRGMMEFYKAALQGAITNPLCAEYKNEWRKCGDDKEKMVMLALRQQSLPYLITHCYNGKGLTKEYILDTFPDFINGKRTILDADLVKGYSYSIYVDFKAISKPDTDVTAFMWCDCPQVEINTAKCPTFYIGCGSEIHLVCNGYNSPHIYLFDDSKLVIDDADDTCSFVVYRYSDKATVERGKWCTTDNIKIFDKTLRL